MVVSGPLVSIVIPCYRHARFLPAALDSALAQTYQPIEVIVVDDGSPDDTAQVAAAYPVTLIRQANAGHAAAVNAGIRASRGEFVVRLDADDVLVPTYVEETVTPMLVDPGLDFVYTEVAYFGARTGTYPTEDFDPESIAERNYVHASAAMRRSAFEAVGGYREDMRRLRCEDWDLWMSFAEHGRRGRLVPRPLLRYRQHATASMVTIDVRSLRGLRREWQITGRLAAHHPTLLAPGAVCRRAARVPLRVARREISLRFGVLLIAFSATVLLHSALAACRGRLAARSTDSARV